ncbi:MAG: Gfo/Idh/MocA family oxidoreductase [bacterium]|nr:Gfo/Idh/MocA family oxidoreductase [bacterium]
MAENIRWGILSTGLIAGAFVRDLQPQPGMEIVAVGSRTQASADSFGEQWSIPRRYASYEALAADPDVDVIYIGTPHPYHVENTLLCLDTGKAVLCEKPFAMNTHETRRMIDRAREKGLFLMEAMWTRFSPLMQRLTQLLDEGVIGEVRLLNADFGFAATFDAQHRLFNPALGGGALLDVGIYPISLASLVFRQQPQTIHSAARLGETGVDEQNALLFHYANGAMAQISSAVSLTTPQEALILGTKGRIRIHTPFWKPNRLTIIRDGKDDQVVTTEDSGYHFQALDVAACLRAGKTESDRMPLDETLAIMGTLDSIRTQWGLVYPMEQG